MSIFASNPNDIFGSRAQEQFAALARSQKGNNSNTLNQNVTSKSVQKGIEIRDQFESSHDQQGLRDALKQSNDFRKLAIQNGRG